MRKSFTHTALILAATIGLSACCNDNDNITVSKENWTATSASDSQTVDKSKEGFGLGFEPVIEFSPRTTFVSGNFEDFDALYVKARSGEYIDCDKLVNTTATVHPSSHMAEAHNEPDYTFRLHDYMIASGNDFTSLDVCAEEIEQARVSLCEHMDDIVASTEAANIVAKQKGDTMRFGYSISDAAAAYCNGYHWVPGQTASIAF